MAGLRLRKPDFFDLVLAVMDTDDGDPFHRYATGSGIVDFTGHGFEAFGGREGIP